MKYKTILHAILKGMDPYKTTGVPKIYYNLSVKLIDKIYGPEGVALLDKYISKYDTSVTTEESWGYTIDGRDDPNSHVGPKELIQKLENLPLLEGINMLNVLELGRLIDGLKDDEYKKQLNDIVRAIEVFQELDDVEQMKTLTAKVMNLIEKGEPEISNLKWFTVSKTIETDKSKEELQKEYPEFDISYT